MLDWAMASGLWVSPSSTLSFKVSLRLAVRRAQVWNDELGGKDTVKKVASVSFHVERAVEEPMG